VEQKDAKRSELAKRLHSQPHPDDPTRRKFGGPQPGSGRPRVKRASTRAAEAAAENAQQIIDAFKRGVNSADERTALMAAEKWLNVEREEAGLQMDEQRLLEDMSRADLIEMLAKGFAALGDAGVIDVHAVDAQDEDDSVNPFMLLADQ